MKRNIILSLSCAAAMLIMLPSFGQGFNKLTDKEKKEGWVLLFNGKDFQGWRQCNGTAMPKNWVIEDGTMKVFTAEGKKPGEGSNGDIVFGDKKFKNFELSVDWKASKMANSGIFYNVREVPGQPIYYAAPEVQILDNVDATDNKVASHLAGSLYDMIAADPKTVHPAGEWNTMVITINNGKVTQVQNGTKVAEYELWTPAWDKWLPTANLRTSRVLPREFQRRASLGCRIMVILYGSGISRFTNYNRLLIYWYRAQGKEQKNKGSVL
jgi:hypothetical protein